MVGDPWFTNAIASMAPVQKVRFYVEFASSVGAFSKGSSCVALSKNMHMKAT